MIKLSRLIKEDKDNRLDKYFKNFNWIVFGTNANNKKKYIIKFCKNKHQAQIWNKKIEKVQDNYRNNNSEKFNNWGYEKIDKWTQKKYQNAIYTNGKITGYK